MPDLRDGVELYLPAGVYAGTLVLHDRPFDLYGAEEGGRTVFAGGIQMRAMDEQIVGGRVSYLSRLDFTGDGGVGVSAAGRVWIQECAFSGWKTAVLSYGETWINVTDCTFRDNVTGLHFNDANATPSDSHFTGNTFEGNGTAVLLEAVPSDLTLDFSDCVFTGNGTDIDNRCGQPVNIAQAVFQ